MSMFTKSDPLLSGSILSNFGFTLSTMAGEPLGPLSPPWDDDDLMDFKLDDGLSSVNDIEELLSCSPNSLRFDNEGETDDSSSSFGANDDASSSLVSTNEDIILKASMFQTDPKQNVDNLWPENDEENFSIDPSDPIWDAILEKVNILDGECDEKQRDLNLWDASSSLNTREANSQMCLPVNVQMVSPDILIENSLQRSLKTFINHGYCSVCKVCFQSQELLKSHQDEFLLKNVCCQCSKKLDNASKLKNHWRKHNKEKPFQCKWCDKYYSQKNSLVRHQNLYCELAKGKHGRPEFSETTLHSGLKLRLMPEDPNHIFSKVPDLITKSNISHPSELSNQSKPSKLKSSDLTNQMETNTTCRICNRKFYDIKSLENHRLHHQSQKSCCSCNKVMASKSKLMIHCRSHTKEFPFTCNICNRSFAERSTLRKHISTHGEKSFQCDSCGKAFARKDYLTKHSQVHRQLYKCSQCTFQCNNAGEIELHLSIHQRVQSALEES